MLPRVRTGLRFSIYGLTTALGLLALLYPFLWPYRAAALATRSTAWLTLIVTLCFLALLLETQGDAASPKFTALLGVLTALNAVLRFIEIAIPGPGGFSPIFFLILATGYVYGARFGFLMGALTLLVSALITGGVGPWLPFQMLVAGWVGLSAPLLRLLRLPEGPVEVGALAVWGALWGLGYGVLINLWFWPLTLGPLPPGLPWAQAAAETLRRYVVFYAATSLLWDLAGALGNAGLLLAFGAPTLRALRRFRRRFAFTYRPEPA